MSKQDGVSFLDLIWYVYCLQYKVQYRKQSALGVVSVWD